MELLNLIRRMSVREKLPIREIARRTGLSRNTVKKHLNAGTVEPKFAISVRPSKLDPFSEKLAGWLKSEAGKTRKQRRTLKQLHADLVIATCNQPRAFAYHPAMNSRTIAAIIEEAAGSLGCSVRRYWPMTDTNELAERNQTLHLASAFLRRGWRCWAEVHWSEGASRRLDLLTRRFSALPRARSRVISVAMSANDPDIENVAVRASAWRSRVIARDSSTRTRVAPPMSSSVIAANDAFLCVNPRALVDMTSPWVPRRSARAADDERVPAASPTAT